VIALPVVEEPIPAATTCLLRQTRTVDRNTVTRTNEQSTTCEAQHHEGTDLFIHTNSQTEKNTSPPQLQTEASQSSSEVSLTPLIRQIKNLLFVSISEHRLQDLLVQDQRARIAGELTPLEEYSALEHDRQLTQLHSRLAEESTRDQKGHYDPDLDQLHTAIDSIFNSLPTLVQLPDFSEPSSVLFQ